MRAERVTVLVSSSRSLRPQLSVRRFLLLFRFLWIALVIYRKYSLSSDCTSWSSICMRPCFFLISFGVVWLVFMHEMRSLGILVWDMLAIPGSVLRLSISWTLWWVRQVCLWLRWRWARFISFLPPFVCVCIGAEMLTLFSSFLSVEKVRKRGIGKILGWKTLAIRIDDCE